MTDPLVIKIRKATVMWRRHVLFSNLNLEIRKNQHWAVVGKTGSGKSALLRTLAGEYRLSDGQIDHCEYERYRKSRAEANPSPPARRRAVYVDIRHDFQPLAGAGESYYQQRFNAGYADSTPTVADYLARTAGDGLPKAPWNLDRLFEQFQLAAIAHRHLMKLSSGENKRLRMAAALLQNPVLLLLDCPLAGLDAETRQNFEDLFYKIAESGICLVMATNPDQIPGVITHVAALDQNRKLSVCPRQTFGLQNTNFAAQGPADRRRLKRLMHAGSGQKFNILVSMENARVAYGTTVVFENISWQIRPGQRWALAGPNGSGKSTLLSLINGDHPQAYANDMMLFDRKRGSGESIWEIKQKIGFMSPELFQYFPAQYTCIQTVESGFYDTLGMFFKSRKENRELAGQWMEIMGLSELKNRRFFEVSAGQQRLCLLARALVKNPYLLLLDEPCQGLDPEEQQRFGQLLDTMADISSMAMVYVTHQPEQLPACIQQTLHLGCTP